VKERTSSVDPKAFPGKRMYRPTRREHKVDGGKEGGKEGGGEEKDVSAAKNVSPA